MNTKLTVQVLVSTMNRDDFSLIDHLNLQTDAIIVNQCEKFGIHCLTRNQHKIIWIDMIDRGVSKSRNLAISFATGDICLFVDDDEILCDDYQNRLIKYFNRNKKISICTFNIESINNVRKRFFIKKYKKLHKWEVLKYGAARIAARRNFLISRRLLFPLDFGPGAPYNYGEDSLFLYDSIKKGGIIYSIPETIASIDDSSSSWFNGYNEKFFFNKGAFFEALSPSLSFFYCLQFMIRHNSIFSSIGLRNGWKKMREGTRFYRKQSRS